MKSRLAKNLISIAAVLLLLLSVLPGQTLAWRDFSQHDTNEFIGLNMPEQEEEEPEERFAPLTITKRVIILEPEDEPVDLEDGSGGNLPPADDPVDSVIASEGEAIHPNTADESEPVDDPLAPLAHPKFQFVITFAGVPDGTYTVAIDGLETEMEIINGQLIIELGDGQTAVIKDLPVGSSYEVIETPAEGYTPFSPNEKGRLPAEGAQVDYINYLGEGGPVDPEEETEPPETPKPPGKPKPKPKPPVTPPPIGEGGAGPYRPVTGDETNIWLWVALMLAAALALRYTVNVGAATGSRLLPLQSRKRRGGNQPPAE